MGKMIILPIENVTSLEEVNIGFETPYQIKEFWIDNNTDRDFLYLIYIHAEYTVTQNDAFNPTVVTTEANSDKGNGVKISKLIFSSEEKHSVNMEYPILVAAGETNVHVFVQAIVSNMIVGTITSLINDWICVVVDEIAKNTIRLESSE